MNILHVYCRSAEPDTLTDTSKFHQNSIYNIVTEIYSKESGTYITHTDIHTHIRIKEI